MGDIETNSPTDTSKAVRKWKIKVGKALFVSKATIQKEQLEHIQDAKSPKDAWDVFATLLSRSNDARLQLLENDLGTISQGITSIFKYFMQVKGICNEIPQLDSVKSLRHD